jgi:hypothetical protein
VDLVVSGVGLNSHCVFIAFLKTHNLYDDFNRQTPTGPTVSRFKKNEILGHHHAGFGRKAALQVERSDLKPQPKNLVPSKMAHCADRV